MSELYRMGTGVLVDLDLANEWAAKARQVQMPNEELILGRPLNITPTPP